MKFRNLTLLIAFFAMTFNVAELKAQASNPLMPDYKRPPIYIGPTIGYNRSMHSVELKSFADEALCPVFENGSSSGFWAGITWEQPLGELKNSTSSIIVRAMYSLLPASLEVAGNRYPSYIPIVDQNGVVTGSEIAYSSTVHTNEVTYNIVSVEACYKLNPFQGMNLGFTIGPTFDYVLTKDHDQQFNLVEPLNAQFKKDADSPFEYTNNDRTIIVEKGEIPESAPFRLGIKAGVQYEIILKNRAYVVPAIYYNFGVTELTSQEDWRVNALQIGVDVRFAF